MGDAGDEIPINPVCRILTAFASMRMPANPRPGAGAYNIGSLAVIHD